MNEQKPVPQKPSKDGMTRSEVTTQWLYVLAEQIGVRLGGEKDDRS